MKTFRLLFLGLVATFMFSCTGNNDANQQVVTPNAPVQPAPAVVDSTQAPAAQAPAPAAVAPAANTQALPEAVTAFLSQHFPDASVVRFETDSEHGGLEYDVYLSDGSKVDFDASNQWDNVECRTKAVPASIVPQAITNYVKSNYPSVNIFKIDKDINTYDVELSNGLDLVFDLSGRFLSIDD